MRPKLTLQDGTVVTGGQYHVFQSYHASQRVVLPVFGELEGKIVGLGTAVCVGPGWFVTARHVVQDWDGSDPALVASHSRLWVYLETDEKLEPDGTDDEDGLYGGLCEVRRVCSHPEVDLSTLTVDMPGTSFARLRHLTLGLRMPAVGEVVSVLGYPDMSVDEVIGEDGTLLLDRKLAVSVGEVLEQQHQRVPQSMRESPGFATNAALMSGMSGGAVIDSQEEVIGFATSSFPPTKDFPEWNSWAAGVAAVLELDLSLQVEGLTDKHFSVAHLIATAGIECRIYRSFGVDDLTGNAEYVRLDDDEEDSLLA